MFANQWTFGLCIFWKTQDITLLGYIAHARLGFEKALDYDKKKAGYAMELFQQLYAVERHARDSKLDDQQRHQLRLEKVLPICNQFGRKNYLFAGSP